MSLTVERIENGTVVDHIPAGQGIMVMRILGITNEYRARVALIMNVKSKKMGKKDILKVEEKYLDDAALDRVALVAPNATINLVKGGKVMKKRDAVMPKKISGLLTCPNPKCITNFEQAGAVFLVEGKGVRCAYCERAFPAEELV